MAKTVSLPIDVDGRRVSATTAVERMGGYAVSIITVIPQAGLALELQSTYLGHPGAETLSTHLLLAVDVEAQSVADVHEPGLIDVLHDPRSCLYDHAMRLQDFLQSLGYESHLHIEQSAIVAVESV